MKYVGLCNRRHLPELNMPVFPFALDTAHGRHPTSCWQNAKERKFHHAGETRGRAERSSGSCRVPKWEAGGAMGTPGAPGRALGIVPSPWGFWGDAGQQEPTPHCRRWNAMLWGLAAHLHTLLTQGGRSRPMTTNPPKRCWIRVTPVSISHSFIYLFTATQGLPSRTLAFCSCSEPGSQFRSVGHTAGLPLQSTAGCRAQASAGAAHGLSCPSQVYGIFPNQGSNSCPLRWQADS